MAAPATLTATTLEGQLLQLIEFVTNAQLIAINSAAPGVTVRRIITSNTTDDMSGTKIVNLSLPVLVNTNTTGIATEAVEVY
ncbi:MAG: hypothetical protein U7126_15320 [Microcoleus sp.]